MSDDAAEFGDLADELLAAGRVDELVEQLADPELVDLWDDLAVVGAVAEAHGRHVASSRSWTSRRFASPVPRSCSPCPGRPGSGRPGRGRRPRGRRPGP